MHNFITYILRYCAATGRTYPVNLPDFGEWLEKNYPEVNEQFEKHVAEVFNRTIYGDKWDDHKKLAAQSTEGAGRSHCDDHQEG